MLGDKRILDAAAPIFAARLATYSVPPEEKAAESLAYAALRHARLLVEVNDRQMAAERQAALATRKGKATA